MSPAPNRARTPGLRPAATGMGSALPLAAAQARLGKPGRPRTRPIELALKGDRGATESSPIRMDSGAAAPRQAGVLLPRLLTVEGACTYLSLKEDTVLELLQAGIFRRVTVPAPVTAKRRGGAIRKVLLDREEIDVLIARWKV
jgi:hypothetical protein